MQEIAALTWLVAGLLIAGTFVWMITIRRAKLPPEVLARFRAISDPHPVESTQAQDYDATITGIEIHGGNRTPTHTANNTARPNVG